VGLSEIVAHKKVAKVVEKEPNKTLYKIMHNTGVSRTFLSRSSFIPV